LSTIRRSRPKMSLRRRRSLERPRRAHFVVHRRSGRSQSGTGSCSWRISPRLNQLPGDTEWPGHYCRTPKRAANERWRHGGYRTYEETLLLAYHRVHHDHPAKHASRLAPQTDPRSQARCSKARRRSPPQRPQQEPYFITDRVGDVGLEYEALPAADQRVTQGFCEARGLIRFGCKLGGQHVGVHNRSPTCARRA
jgi:hypothetical protein